MKTSAKQTYNSIEELLSSCSSSILKNHVSAMDVPASKTEGISYENSFRYAKTLMNVGASVTIKVKHHLNRLSKWHCGACACPLRREGIRRFVCCPNCGTENG